MSMTVENRSSTIVPIEYERAKDAAAKLYARLSLHDIFNSQMICNSPELDATTLEAMIVLDVRNASGKEAIENLLKSDELFEVRGSDRFYNNVKLLISVSSPILFAQGVFN